MGPDRSIEPYLEGDEAVLWSGRPRQGLRFVASDIIMVPFSIFWLFFTVLWIGLSVISLGQSGPPVLLWSFVVLGGLFFLVGLYLAVGRFLVDAASRQATTFVLTNRRALIISGLTGRHLRAVVLVPGLELHMGEGVNGMGWISFGALPAVLPGATSWAFSLPLVFDGVPQVRDVYRMARAIVDPERGD